jgi:hypothetical protein
MDKNTYTLIEDENLLEDIYNDYKDRFEEKNFDELKLRFDNNFKVLNCGENNLISLCQFIPRRSNAVKVEDFYKSNETTNGSETVSTTEEEPEKENLIEEKVVETTKEVETPQSITPAATVQANTQVKETNIIKETVSKPAAVNTNTDKDARRLRIEALLKIASVDVDSSLLSKIIRAVDIDYECGKDADLFLPKILKFVEDCKKL